MSENVITIDFNRRQKELPVERFARHLIDILTSEEEPAEAYELTHRNLGLLVGISYDPNTNYDVLHNEYVEADKAFGDEGLIGLFASQDMLSAEQMQFLSYVYQELHLVLVDRMYFNTIDFKLPGLEIVCCHNDGNCVGVVMRLLPIE